MRKMANRSHDFVMLLCIHYYDFGMGRCKQYFQTLYYFIRRTFRWRQHVIRIFKQTVVRGLYPRFMRTCHRVSADEIHASLCKSVRMFHYRYFCAAGIRNDCALL